MVKFEVHHCMGCLHGRHRLHLCVRLGGLPSKECICGGVPSGVNPVFLQPEQGFSNIDRLIAACVPLHQVDGLAHGEVVDNSPGSVLAGHVARLNSLIEVVVDIDNDSTGWAVDSGASDLHLADGDLEAVARVEVV
jgi:hypothetical protein